MKVGGVSRCESARAVLCGGGWAFVPALSCWLWYLVGCSSWWLFLPVLFLGLCLLSFGSVSTQLGVLGCVFLFKSLSGAMCSSVCVPRAPREEGLSFRDGWDPPPQLPRPHLLWRSCLRRHPLPRALPSSGRSL